MVIRPTAGLARVGGCSSAGGRARVLGAADLVTLAIEAAT